MKHKRLEGVVGRHQKDVRVQSRDGGAVLGDEEALDRADRARACGRKRVRSGCCGQLWRRWGFGRCGQCRGTHWRCLRCRRRISAGLGARATVGKLMLGGDGKSSGSTGVTFGFNQRKSNKCFHTQSPRTESVNHKRSTVGDGGCLTARPAPWVSVEPVQRGAQIRDVGGALGVRVAQRRGAA